MNRTEPPPDVQVAFYRAHPPRALGALAATPVDVDFPFDGHGEPVNAFVFDDECA